MITNCHTKYEGTARKTRLPGAPGLFERFWMDRGILILAAVIYLAAKSSNGVAGGTSVK